MAKRVRVVTLVSVVICSYNSADTLGTALDSALSQSISSADYEVILVDDGSSDDTCDLAETYLKRNSNLRTIRLGVNEGLVSACNHGLKASRGRYLIRLDADDRFHRDILSSCLHPLENDQTDLVYSDRYDVSLADGDKQLVKLEPFDLFRMIASGTMMRTDLMREIGGYRDLFWEEYDLYLRYLQRSPHPPVHVPRPLYYYSRHASSMTADRTRVHEGWNQLKSLWGEKTLIEYGWQGMEQGTWE
ncbi:MAG: glycosyltransferase family 2 protein [Chloroflexi bacterium]|nr:glycosyltransferase family 2 protein [Chloroflexota bacterium]